MADRWFRMSHMKQGHWCPAWEVKEEALRLWKTGKEPFRASQARLPNGKDIAPGSRIECGTCGGTTFKVEDMRVTPVPTQA